MESKHTSGPWKLSSTPSGRHSVVTEDHQKAICDIWGAHNPLRTSPMFVTVEQADANAKLIAAAPELLKLLGNILNISEDKGIAGCTYNDTDFDSLSAAYGYNTSLNYIKDDIYKELSKLNLL